MSKRYEPAIKDRAIRLAKAEVEQTGSLKRACREVGARMRISPDSVRGWVIAARRADEKAVTVTTTDDEVLALRRRVKALEEENAILRSAATFFAGELDPRRR